MEDYKIKVYAKLDGNKVITSINSSIFLTDVTDWTEIDEGIGDKYAHAQGNYLEKGLTDSNGKYNYKYDKKLIELTEAEKEALFHTPIQEPTFEEIQNEINIDTDFRLSCLELGI